MGLLTPERFETGVRQNAMEFDAADLNRDRVLSFDEFSDFVREREVGIFPEAVLRRRFEDMDENRDGYVSVKEYIVWSLRDALRRSTARVRDLFQQWDADNSASIDKREFRRAMRSLGIDARNDELDAVFSQFDCFDSDGTLSLAEFDKQLRKRADLPELGPSRDVAISAQALRPLRRGPQNKLNSMLASTDLTLDASKGDVQDRALSGPSPLPLYACPASCHPSSWAEE